MTLTMSYVGSQGRFLNSRHSERTWVLHELSRSEMVVPWDEAVESGDGNGPANLAAAGLSGLPYPSFGGTQNPSISQYLKPFPQYTSISDPYGFIGTHVLQRAAGVHGRRLAMA